MPPNPTVREAAGLAAKRRVLEHYQWPKIAADIERVYLETMGIEPDRMSAKKPSGRVEAQALPINQKAG